MNVFYTDRFVLPLPAGHKFPMSKYEGVRRTLEQNQWVNLEQLKEPIAATDTQLARAHHEQYLKRVAEGGLTYQEVRRIGFPWSEQMVERSRRSSGATIEACYSALHSGISVSLAGGTHHAFYEKGEGFCVYNDSVVAARELQATGKVKQVLVIDLDVHQGNGTASICRDDPSIFTFSMHGEKNFPYRKETSDWDIALPDGTGDEEYLKLLNESLPKLIANVQPDLAIYLAGADPWEGDRWGRLGLTKQGLSERDQVVFQTLSKAGIPLAVTMSGGYAPNVQDTIDIHVETVRQAFKFAPQW